MSKIKEGWICPRCRQVNAPWVAKCDCEPKEFPNVQKIEWEHNGSIYQSEVQNVKCLGDRLYYSVKENKEHDSGVVSETYVLRLLIDGKWTKKYSKKQ